MPLFSNGARPNGHTSYIRHALRLRIPFGIATIVLALAGLASNAVGAAPDMAIHPLTAVSLVGLGAWTLRMKRFGQVPIAQALIAGLVLMVCSARVMIAAMAPWTGAAPLAVFGPIGGLSGEFGVDVSLGLGAFAAAALLRQGPGRWGTFAFMGGLIVTFNAILQVSFGAAFFAGGVRAMSVLGLVFIAGAMASVYVHRPFVRVAFLMGDIGHQTRVVLLAALLIPWSCGVVLHAVRPFAADGVAVDVAMISAVTWGLVITLLATTARLEGTAVARRRAEREIAMQRRIDPLTKALNRFGMMEALEGAWLDYRSRGSMFGLLLMDLDYFKRINDTFGHEAGDDVLTRVAQTVQPHLRDTDALGRWGGGEFLILLKIKQKEDLAVVVSRLRAALEDVTSPFCEGLAGAPVQISASFGPSVMSDTDHGPSEAVTRADVALHMARDAAAPPATVRVHRGQKSAVTAVA